MTVLAVVLVAASILTAGRTGNANFLESTLGFVITPLQKVTTNVSSFFGDKFSNIKNEKQTIKIKSDIDYIGFYRFFTLSTLQYLFPEHKLSLFSNS